MVQPTERETPAQQQASADRASLIVQAGRDVRDIRIAPVGAAAIPVSVAPPWGRRDPAHPLRGRADLVDQLVGIVTGRISGPSSRVFVVHGLSGCGKSAVALEVAHHAAMRGVRVWWVEATDVGVFEAGMFAVARDAGAADEALRRGDAADVAWRMLHQYSSPWLLIVDGAEDLSMLTVAGRPLADGCGWVRPPGTDHGTIIVTSREGNARQWGAWATRCFVDVLGIADAAFVLLDHAGAEAGPAGDAESLAARLAGLPLALRLAGAYLNRSCTSPWRGSIASFAAYKDAYDDAARAWPAERPLTPIDHTWSRLLDVLDRRDLPHARHLLWLLSTLAEAPIPYQLLLTPAGISRSSLFPDIDGPNLWEMVQALTDLGLVDFQDSAPASGSGLYPPLRMHQLVRDAARRQARDAGMLGACFEVTAALVGRAASELGDPNDPAAWPKWLLLAPHAFAVVRIAAETLESQEGIPAPAAIGLAADAAEQSAAYLQAAGHFTRAESQLRLVLQTRLRIADAEHLAALSSRHRLAHVLHDLGRYEEAQMEHEKVLRVRERLLGHDHRDTLHSRYHIADLLSHRGDEIAAETECRAVLQARLKTRGEIDSDTLDSRHQLCYILRRLGRLAEAEVEYRAVLQLRQEQHGIENHKTLVTRFQLADLLHRQGRLAEAREHYEAVLPARRRILGDQHVITLVPWYGLAVLLHQMGEIAASRQAHEEIYQRAVETFGPNHRYTLFTKEPIEHLRTVNCHTECGNPESISKMRCLTDEISF